MARKVLWAAGAAAFWALSGAAWASGDGGCYASWKLISLNRECASRAIIAPSNDSQVNLLFLLRDKAGLDSRGLSYPKQGWNSEGFGRAFFDWKMLSASFYPARAEEEGEARTYQGTRCNSLAGGTSAFGGALAANSGVPAPEKAMLSAARERLAKTCEIGAEALRQAQRYHPPGEAAPPPPPPLPAWPVGITSPAGAAFLAYLQGSDAFYGERWAEARTQFSKLGRARDPWVAETAAYMLGRVELNAAMAKSTDEYGSYAGTKSVDQEAVKRANTALAAYLKAYPKGRYAASADGLQRRALWLSGDAAALSREYERLLGALGGRDERSLRMIEEIDGKLLFPGGAQADDAPQGALLLATYDLARMRYDSGDEGKVDANAPPKFPLAELQAQQAAFAGQPSLWSFLLANHAFYVAKDYRRVLALIPDEARQDYFSPLAFSRQMLRGLALARLGDRNEAGFWLELLGGGNGLWQRPTIELALALNYERHGKVADVFVKGSPIADSDIRMILLSHSASPETLRAQALDRARPAIERNVALHTLLNKALSYGNYGLFLANQNIAVPAIPEDSAMLASLAAQQLPSFTKGKWSEGYSCPALAETARRLAANPLDSGGRLCLGEFWRLNDFDPAAWDDSAPEKDELGGAADLFPGKATSRGPIYAAIIADPRAPAADKAFALYRAVNCYGPSGYNGCGGAEVDKAMRRGWFQQLKRDYATSEWARRQRIFW